MKKKLTSILAVALVTTFLIPSIFLNNNTQSPKSHNRINTCFCVDPPSVE